MNSVDRELARLLHHEAMGYCSACGKRYSRITMHAHNDHAHDGRAVMLECVPYSEFENNPLTSAIAEAGMVWERSICTKHPYAVCTIGKDKMYLGDTLAEAFRNALKARKEGE